MSTAVTRPIVRFTCFMRSSCSRSVSDALCQIRRPRRQTHLSEAIIADAALILACVGCCCGHPERGGAKTPPRARGGDRKSTRLNSSHLGISYAVFCLKKKKNNDEHQYRTQQVDTHIMKHDK